MGFVYLTLGAIIGVIIGYRLKQKIEKPVGTICVDYSDPTDTPYLFFKMEQPLQFWAHNKQITVKVEKTCFLESTRN